MTPTDFSSVFSKLSLSKRQYFILGFMVFLFLYAKFIGYIGINTDVSLPYRVFYVDKLHTSDFKKGDIVVFRFWGSDYYSEGKQFVKMVSCVSGSYLKVAGRDFYCDGVYLGRAKEKDKWGKEVSPFFYDGIVPKGKYFVLGTHFDSYDSRYYGFVDESYITGRAYPIF